MKEKDRAFKSEVAKRAEPSTGDQADPPSRPSNPGPREIASLIEQLARSAVRHTRCALDPLDVTQEVLLAALTQNGSFAVPTHVEHPNRYYAVVVRNRVRRLLQRDQAQHYADWLHGTQSEVDWTNTPESIVMQRERLSMIVQSLRERLRPAERAALEAILDGDTGTGDLARRLGITANNVHQLRHRIRRVLRRRTVRTRSR